MISSLFTIALSQLDINTVLSFCNQGFSEGLRIEYKKEFPRNLKLAETVCAFANTQGGLILIGVEADKKYNKPKNVTGVELKGGLEEKIINLCLSHISPSITPEVKVVDFKSDPKITESDRAILFIRVRASYIAPHYLLSTNEIPIRVHCRNALADLRTIENLIERRKNFGAIDSESYPFYDGKIIDVDSVAIETVKITPKFRQIEPIIDFYNKETSNWLLQITNEVMTLHEQSPKPWELKFFSKNQQTKKITRYCGINRNGEIYFQHAANVTGNKYNPLKTITFITNVLMNAKKIYDKFGFFGELSVGLTLMSDKNLILSLKKYHFDDDYQYTSNKIMVDEDILYDDLSTPKAILENFLKKICINFGLILYEKQVRELIEETLSTNSEFT